MAKQKTLVGSSTGVPSHGTLARVASFCGKRTTTPNRRTARVQPRPPRRLSVREVEEEEQSDVEEDEEV